MIGTPFQELNKVLEKLVSGIEDSLADILLGVYLQESFALGDFDEHSDVDFIVVIKDSLLPDQVEPLQV
jgi:predicted nucleotidyltransferase